MYKVEVRMCQNYVNYKASSKWQVKKKQKKVINSTKECLQKSLKLYNS